MKIPNDHTLEEHREYLYQIVRLKLFFLHNWLREHQDETFQYVLRNRVDIYRKCDANPGGLNPVDLHFDEAPWLELENAAGDIYNSCKNDIQAFEDRAFLVFKPSLDARCERDYTDDSAQQSYAKCGCGSLKHEDALRDEETVAFHISNMVSPKSIFTDRDYLPKCFMKMMDAVEKKLGAKRIRTGTWLNENPKWLEYFPREWMDNMEAPLENVQWHYGFWGQFISARHTFNAKYGDILRKTGRLPFYPRVSNCSIAAMREKISTFL